MASLSNINGIFDVHSTGAIQFNGNHGASGQILKSNGNAAPTWVAASTVIGGPYLPLSGGTLTGATATASGISFTVGGDLTVGSTSKTTNTVVQALSNDDVNAGFEARGASQGTGYFYAGQSGTHGGGMFYNGNGAPAFAAGETNDAVSFYRRAANVQTVVFDFMYNSNTVRFKGGITLAGSITGTTGTFSGLVSGITPTAAANFATKAYVDAHPGSGGTVTSVGGTGTVSGITLTGTVTSTGNLTLGGTLSASITNISNASNWWNNFGDVHGTRTGFDASTASYGFGWRYVQGNTNGPGTGGTQFYSAYVGLGSQYPATGSGSYGAYLAFDRNVANPYLSIRYNEANALGTWKKISAGTADVLTTARTIAGVSFNGSANISLNNNAITNGAGYTTNTGDITGVTAGTGMTGGGTSGTVTLNVIGGSGITANANDIAVDSTVIRTTGNQSMSGIKSFTGAIATSGAQTRNKISVWSNTTEYTIGMRSGYTFGGLSNEYAMSFQMNNNNGRGFWWGDTGHTNAQGAMSLTTQGILAVAGSLRLGFGESDTTSAAYSLQVNGTSYSANGNTAAFICGPNSSYGAGTELEIGGWTTGTTVSRIRNSNGNLHIDSKSGHTLYLNHYPAGNILTCNGGGYLMSYQSMRSPIFYDYLNTLYYGDFGSTTMGKYFGRQAHNEGFQVGGYNNVGENSTRSNPIYTIGSSYMPASTTLSNMYGIGYTHSNASFIGMVGASGWGMYVASDGDARVYLGGGNGRVSATGAMYSPIYYDTNTSYYGNFASTSRLNTLNCDGAITSGTSSTGNIYCGNVGSTHFRFHTVSNTTYFDMNSGTIRWRQGSSTRFYFYPSTANMTINGTLTQNSDIRIKENVIEINDCISKVQGMRGVYYNRTDFNTEVTKVGVIAQEVEAVLPELILENEESGLKSVAYSELTAVLINAIKEQQVIIDDLKSRIETLEL